jgi:hypothetical protein
MARKNKSQQKGSGPFHRVAEAITGLFSRRRTNDEQVEESRSTAARSESTASATAAAKGRVTRREADIPLDVLDRSYTPPMTSSKASFRSNGADHHSDQEYAMGSSDERWNDEDRLTNKSGDPRIGTHRRTYEPGEARPESRE